MIWPQMGSQPNLNDKTAAEMPPAKVQIQSFEVNRYFLFPFNPILCKAYSHTVHDQNYNNIAYIIMVVHENEIPVLHGVLSKVH